MRLWGSINFMIPLPLAIFNVTFIIGTDLLLLGRIHRGVPIPVPWQLAGHHRGLDRLSINFSMAASWRTLVGFC
ncbi:hypothetical protein M426DRAFT_321552 [Hypoxylon sp. CI-4A]|nr:hypothetical protein M426DRAFT_321552 [Hypoxylon sp. CI-4A]